MTDFSRGKVALGDERKVFDKMPLREMGAIVDFSRDERKVFDKMPLKEMGATVKQGRMKCLHSCLDGFKSRWGAVLTPMRPLPKPPPTLDFYKRLVEAIESIDVITDCLP